VLRFALAGFGAIALLGVLLMIVFSRIATTEALKAAREGARLAGYGIVEPAASASLLGSATEAAPAIATLDELVATRILSEQVVRVKIWTVDGRIVYSDEPRLVGTSYPPKDDHAEAIRTGSIGAEIAHTDGPENQFERNTGRLLEVYMPLRATDGTPLVYEQYQTYDSIVGNRNELFRQLALPLLGCVAALWMVQLPLAGRLAARVQRAEAAQRKLAEAAMQASTRERQRVAVQLHDGVVQDLAGLTYELGALGARSTDPAARNTLVRSADIARIAMQRVRASLLDLNPDSVESIGLTASFEELADLMRARGIDVGLHIEADDLGPDTQALLYRVGRELLRNVDEHAQADRADVNITHDRQAATLVVSDNGIGIDPQRVEARRKAGHVGLDLHRAVVEHEGGSVSIDSRPGEGTTVAVRVPT
jgi:two-component system, NarL family, sensor kinase